jgi:hypothetical protein
MAEYVSTHLVEITKMSFLPAQNQVHRTRCTEAIADTCISIHLVLELIFDLESSFHNLVFEFPDTP